MLDNEGSTAGLIDTALDDSDSLHVGAIKNTPNSADVRAESQRDMDDTIRDKLREIQARNVEDKPAEATPEEKAQRIRDEQGKFATKVETPAAVVETPAEQPTVPPELQRLGLKKEEAEAYAAAPQALKDAFLRRADEMGRGIEQYKQDAQYAKTMQTAIAPHLQTIQSLGVTPEVAIGELLKADNALRYGSPEVKQQRLMQLATDYGIPFPGQEQVQMDPAMHSMQQELRQMRQQFQTLDQQRESQALNSQIEAFKADPNHSHFDAVRGYMGALIQAGHAPDLQGAYEQAIWANPATRASVLAQQQAAARDEADQKAKAARQAASVNTRPRPSMPVSEPIGTIEDTIRATWRKLQAA